MSIEKKGKRFYFSFRLNGKRHHGACRGCTTERQAAKYEKELRAELEQAEAHHDKIEFHRREIKKLSTAPIPLAEAFDLANAKPTSRSPGEKQITLKKRFFADFVAFCATKKLKLMQEVTPQLAEEYAAYIRENGRYIVNVSYRAKNGRNIEYSAASRKLAPSTTNKMVQTCAWVFDKLSGDSGIARNPFSEIPIMANAYESRDVFTDEEIEKILSATDDFAAPMCRVALYTGLREGDICTLRWSDIVWEKNIIRRKMNKTNRIVEIPIIDRAYLEQLFANRTSEEYVFPAQNAIYTAKPDGIPYRIGRFLRTLGIERNRKSETRTRKISIKDFHSLRHTFAVKCAENGIPIHIVQHVLGHSNPRITEIYTAHYNRTFAQKAMNRFRLLDMNDQAPLIHRLMSALDNFSELLYSEKVKFITILRETLPEHQLDAFIALVRKHMTTPKAEIEALRTAERLRNEYGQREYEEWYLRQLDENTAESKGIAELTMLAASEEE